jgi:hypothetical protein
MICWAIAALPAVVGLSAVLLPMLNRDNAMAYDSPPNNWRQPSLRSSC